MSDLTAFLLARYDEEEAAAREAGDNRSWHDDGTWHLEGVEHNVVGPDEVAFTHPGYVAHIARHDPAYVLADLEAKRRIVELHHPSTDHRPGFNPYCVGCWEAGGEDGAPSYPCPTLRLLALPYASHPDYRAEWKP